MIEGNYIKENDTNYQKLLKVYQSIQDREVTNKEVIMKEVYEMYLHFSFLSTSYKKEKFRYFCLKHFTKIIYAMAIIRNTEEKNKTIEVLYDKILLCAKENMLESECLKKWHKCFEVDMSNENYDFITNLFDIIYFLFVNNEDRNNYLNLVSMPNTADNGCVHYYSNPRALYPDRNVPIKKLVEYSNSLDNHNLHR